jgi:hypothetical protein
VRLAAWSCTLLLLIPVLACGSRVGITGRLTIDGAPARGSDVVLVSDAGRVLEVAKVSDTGAYRLASPAQGQLLFRLRGPIIGVVVRPVPASGAGAGTDLDLDARRAVQLEVALHFPEGVAGPAMFHLTPRGVPEALRGALLVDQPGATARTALFSEARSGTFNLLVLPGPYDLGAEQFVDRPTTQMPSDLVASELRLDDASVPARDGSFAVDLKGPAQRADLTLTFTRKAP